MSEFLNLIRTAPGIASLLLGLWLIWQFDVWRDEHARTHEADDKTMREYIRDQAATLGLTHSNTYTALGKEIADLAKDIVEKNQALVERMRNNVRAASDARDDLERLFAEDQNTLNADVVALRERISAVIESASRRIEGDIAQLRGRIERIESLYFRRRPGATAAP